MVKLVFRSDIRYNQTWRDGGNILGTLLSQTMTAEQKLKLMKQEYDIPVDRHSIREEVKIMDVTDMSEAKIKAIIG